MASRVAPALRVAASNGLVRWWTTTQRLTQAQGLQTLSDTTAGTQAVFGDLPHKVKVVEVGPRDGLQNEPAQVPTEAKVELIRRLAAAGLPVVEATAFVSPKWVPQLADSGQVMSQLRHKDHGPRYPVLVPNLKGFERALAAGAKEVAVFAAASETFSRRNINCSIAESLDRFRDVLQAAHDCQVAVRGYVSCAVACPFEGEVAPAAAASVASRLWSMGCYEVSMGDTIGAGTPASVAAMFTACKQELATYVLAAHLHDTYGQAVANALASLQLGISVFDSSVAGLGGCPYAPGSTGNVATEDLVYMFNGFGIQHGVDMEGLLDAADYICGVLGKPTNSRVGKTLMAARLREADRSGMTSAG